MSKGHHHKSAFAWPPSTVVSSWTLSPRAAACVGKAARPVSAETMTSSPVYREESLITEDQSDHSLVFLAGLRPPADIFCEGYYY